jgi:hypothetical protein
MSLPVEQLTQIKGESLRIELARLRGEQAFTTHSKLLYLPVHKTVKKDEEAEDSEAKRKKKLIVVFMMIAAYFVYSNFF